MSHANLDLIVTDPTADPFERMLLQSLVVMIEVPATKPRSIKRGLRSTSRAVPGVRRRRSRSRRRLRREVCLAGFALLALVPIVSACTLGWSSRPNRIVACSISEPFEDESTVDGKGLIERLASAQDQSAAGQAADASRGVVVLSNEPMAVVPGSGVEIPVVFPGYVLPDDTREDLLHEGS